MMRSVLIAITFASAARATVDEAATCGDVYYATDTDAIEATKCIAAETYVKCMGTAMLTMSSSEQKLVVRQVETAQESVGALDCAKLAPDAPTITVREGNVEMHVQRRDSDVKFYRYARDKDVSIFDLDDKVNSMQALVAAAVVDAAAAVDVSVTALGTQNAAFVTTMADKVATISSSVDAQMKDAAADLDTKSLAISASAAAALVETNAAIATFETVLDDKIAIVTTDLTSGLAGLDAKLKASLTALKNDLQCSYQGEVQSDNTCKCKSGYAGDVCQFKIIENCKEINGYAAGWHKIYRADGSSGLCLKISGQSPWTLLFNLATKVEPPRVYRDTWWTESKSSKSWDSDPSLLEDSKTSDYYDKTDGTEAMVYIHDEGKFKSYAHYDITLKGKSMSSMMKGGTNQKWTGNRKAKVGTTPGPLTSQCCSRPTGDVFMDRTDYLKINKAGGWGAAKNYNRLASNYAPSSGGTPHTFAGLGGWHENGHGDWMTNYEAAPISAYCNLRRGYGSDANHVKLSSHSGFTCRQDFQWVAADFAILVR